MYSSPPSTYSYYYPIIFFRNAPVRRVLVVVIWRLANSVVSSHQNDPVMVEHFAMRLQLIPLTPSVPLYFNKFSLVLAPFKFNTVLNMTD